MAWNYRLISFDHPEEPWIAIHEVHYDGDKPTGYATGAAPVLSTEGVEGAQWVLDRMAEALAKPILDASSFKP